MNCIAAHFDHLVVDLITKLPWRIEELCSRFTPHGIEQLEWRDFLLQLHNGFPLLLGIHFEGRVCLGEPIVLGRQLSICVLRVLEFGCELLDDRP